nr:hypothetical protein GCM10010200_023180 [Actinomadura rugatobispora]
MPWPASSGAPFGVAAAASDVAPHEQSLALSGVWSCEEVNAPMTLLKNPLRLPAVPMSLMYGYNHCADPNR